VDGDDALGTGPGSRVMPIAGRSSVRDAALDVLSECDMKIVFANPGSTEVPFLGDLPDDVGFVLGLHEGAVVGMATGYAIATSRPAFVMLHTVAGLGNGVGALATARVNRAPLVVVVGQQDRRHLAQAPFLGGELDGIAGGYPVWWHQPVQAHDVPGAIRRAWHEARAHGGPAVVTVPMDDWSVPFDAELGAPAPTVVRRADADAAAAIDEVTGMLDDAVCPAIVVGAGADSYEAWTSLVAVAERLDAPVWQEAFGARAGFPQDHASFAGHLPATRSMLRRVLGDHDAVLVVGTSAFRQYLYEPGPPLPEGLIVAVVSDDPGELHRSRADLAVLAPPAAACKELARRLHARDRTPRSRPRPDPGQLPDGGPMSARHVFAALSARVSADTVVVEESPSSRSELHRWLPARMPGGFLSAAMGGLGFAMPAAAGLRMGDPDRPVVAILGDGASLYSIQSLWSAAKYRCGVLYVVMSNGRYVVMDRLARRAGKRPPWPAFADLDIAAMARAMHCDAHRVTTHDELVRALDDVIPTLPSRDTPLLLDVSITNDLEP
jgi:benzoylformate decarboxylase